MAAHWRTAAEPDNVESGGTMVPSPVRAVLTVGGADHGHLGEWELVVPLGEADATHAQDAAASADEPARGAGVAPGVQVLAQRHACCGLATGWDERLPHAPLRSERLIGQASGRDLPR